MINLVFQESKAVQAQLSPMSMLIYASALVEIAERNSLPVDLRVPGNDKWKLTLKTPTEAIAVAKFFVDTVKRMDREEQERKRIAGMSPVSEEIELVTDAEGMPVAAWKRLRY